MGNSVFFGGSIVAAVIAGAIALFAPCCVSVMLPSYLAGSFQNRKVLVAMTFVFGAGVATVILPIALGAQFVTRIITARHTIVFTLGGLTMLGLGAYTLLGGKIHIPMPGRGSSRGGPIGVYSLGVFSGVASSCCAPVLASVIALSGVATSFAVAFALGVAYVFGMVAPLFAIAVLWERRDWRSSRLFHPRSFTWRVGPVRRTIGGSDLLSGVLLVVVGIAMAWVGLTASSMPNPSGFSARLSAHLQHYGHVVTNALSWVPSWAGLLVLAIAIAYLARRALRQVGKADAERTEGPEKAAGQPAEPEEAQEVKEEEVELENQ